MSTPLHAWSSFHWSFFTTIILATRRCCLFSIAVTYCATALRTRTVRCSIVKYCLPLTILCPFGILLSAFSSCLLFVTFGRPQASTFAVGSPAIPPFYPGRLFFFSSIAYFRCRVSFSLVTTFSIALLFSSACCRL